MINWVINMNKTYLNGIYQAKHNDLINIEDIKSLKREKLIDYLKNLNYGNNSNFNNISKALDSELKKIREELNSLSGTNLLGDIFFFEEDLLNIKIVLKSIYYNVSIEDYSIISRFEIDSLYEFFKNNNDSFININDLDLFIKIRDIKGETFKDTLELVEAYYFNYIHNLVNINFPELINYIEAKSFNQNLLTFLKLRNRNDNVLNLEKLLIPQNVFPNSSLIDLFEKSDEQIINELNIVSYSKLEEGLTHFFHTKNVNMLENAFNEALTNISLNNNYNLNSIGPVIYFLHLKKNEVNNIRWLYYENE